MNATLWSLLCALACPLVMGAAMWLMMRGNKEQPGDATRPAAEDATAGPPAASPSAADRLAVLRAQLGQVEAEQATIAAQLNRLVAHDPVAEHRAAGVLDPPAPASLPAARASAEPGAPPPGYSGYCQ